MRTPGATARHFVEQLLASEYVCRHGPTETYHAHAVPMTAAPQDVWENIFRRPLPRATQAQIFCAHQYPFALGIEPYRLYVSLWPTTHGYFAEPPEEMAYAVWLLRQHYQQVLTPAYGHGMKQRRLIFSSGQQTLLDEWITVFPGVYHPWHDLSSQAMIEAMTAAVKPAMRVYIVGLGSGIDARYAARCGAHVRGVDINPLAVWNTRYLFATDAASATLTARVEDFQCAVMFADLRQGDPWYDRIFFNVPSTNAPTRVVADCAVYDPARHILRLFLAQSWRHLAPTGKIVFVHAESEAVHHEAQQLHIPLQEYRASNHYPIFHISRDRG